MIPPVFAFCAARPSVRAVLGHDPVRLYPFGLQDDAPVYPYAVWQVVGGSPDNYLSGRPDVDRYTLQFDVYADTAGEAIAGAQALRDAIEPCAYVTRWGSQTRDPTTKRYRYSFDVDWLVNRPYPPGWAEWRQFTGFINENDVIDVSVNNPNFND